MQFLLHIDVFVGALFSIVPVLAHPHQYYRRYTLSKNCFRDFTFADIADPREYLLTSQRNANVSSGDLCCDLCMRSSENCLFSRYDEETGQCALIINDDINQDTWDLYEPQNSVEEVCKAGVLIGEWTVERFLLPPLVEYSEHERIHIISLVL